MKDIKTKVIAIVGPTASGKTAFAVRLAKKLRGEVISADSRQVYRGATLMSGAATRKEMHGIPHHLLAITNPRKQYSADMFVRDARKAITEITSRGKIPIVCGGTGFYIDALLQGLSLPEVKPNPALRKKLAKKSAPQLFSILQKLDSKRARSIDRRNPVRLIRAIEIAHALGQVPQLTRNPSYNVLWIGLDLTEEILKLKIQRRIASRMRAGMLREAARFRKGGVSFKRMHALGLEFRHLARLLQGKVSQETFTRDLLRDVRAYAKRQRTWFKRNKEIVWMRPSDIARAVSLSKKHLQ